MNNICQQLKSDKNLSQPATGVKGMEAKTAKSSSGENWAEKINGAARKGVLSFIETGRYLNEAKSELGHGNFKNLFQTKKLDVDQRTAQMLMRVASLDALSNAKNYSHLPKALNSLHVLTKLENGQIQSSIDEGKITAAMTTRKCRELVGTIIIKNSDGNEVLIKTAKTSSLIVCEWYKRTKIETLQALENHPNLGSIIEMKLRELLKEVHKIRTPERAVSDPSIVHTAGNVAKV